MDLNTVVTITPAHERADLRLLGDTVAPLAGGSELFADPRVHLTGLVDLQSFGWPALTVTADGLEIAATCTLAQLAEFKNKPDAARKLIAIGESKNEAKDPVELAAWMSVASAILNLDEVLTKD